MPRRVLQAAPMEEQLVRRTGRHESYLMDGGFANTALEQRGVVYAPVRLPRNKPERERYDPRYGDGPDVVRWRQRMATGEKPYTGSQWQWTNAQVRLHGVPIQRTGNQNHQRHAPCRRGPQLPALGGVDGLSGHSGEAPDSRGAPPRNWPKLYRKVPCLNKYSTR